MGSKCSAVSLLRLGTWHPWLPGATAWCCLSNARHRCLLPLSASSLTSGHFQLDPRLQRECTVRLTACTHARPLSMLGAQGAPNATMLDLLLTEDRLRAKGGMLRLHRSLALAVFASMLQYSPAELTMALQNADQFVRSCTTPEGGWESQEQALYALRIFAGALACEVQEAAEQTRQAAKQAAELATFKAHFASLTQCACTATGGVLPVIGLPLRLGLLRAGGEEHQEAARALLAKHKLPESVHAVYSAAVEHSAADELNANFGWMLGAGKALAEGQWREWGPVVALTNAGDAPEEFGPKGTGWSTGCSQVVLGGMVVAVVLRLPSVPGMPFPRPDNKTRLDDAPLEKRLRLCRWTAAYGCVEPSVHHVGQAPVQEAGGGASSLGDGSSDELRYTTFILTPQRSEAFAHLGDVMEAVTSGLCLTAPHGTGKSATMRTMALLLSIGGGADVMYLSGTKALLPCKELSSMAGPLLAGGLSLSCGGVLMDVQVSRSYLMVGENEVKGLGELLGQGGAFARTQTIGAPHCMLLDEANQLAAFLLQHKALRAKGTLSRDEESAEKLVSQDVRQALIGATSWSGACKRVYAYSPDFNLLDLKMPTSADDFRFLEMGAMDTDTMLAVAQGEADGVPVPTDMVLRLPESARQLALGGTGGRRLRAFIHSMGGLARPLARLAKPAMIGVSNITAFKAAVNMVITNTVTSMANRCSDHWSESGAGFEPDSTSGDRDAQEVLFQKGAASSSMVRRKQPTSMSVQYVDSLAWASPTARAAFFFACQQVVADPRSGGAAGGALRGTVERLFRKLTNKMHSDMFESCVFELLLLGVLGNRCTPLSGKAATCPTPLALLGGACGKGVKSWGLEDMLGRSGEQPKVEGKRLPLSLLEQAGSLSRGGRIAIATPNMFPKCDALLVSRTAAGAPSDEVAVVFLEATSSSLEVHGKNPGAHASKSVAGMGGAALAGVPAGLWDLIGLAATDKWETAPDPEADTLTFKSASGRGDTIANHVLKGMGLPLRLQPRVKADGDGTCQFQSLHIVPSVGETVAGEDGSVQGQYNGEQVSFRVYFVYCTNEPPGPMTQPKNTSRVHVPGYFGMFGSDYMPAFLHLLHKAGTAESSRTSSPAADTRPSALTGSG